MTTWLQRGKRDADVVFNGAEHMMTDYIGMSGRWRTPRSPTSFR